MVRVKLYTTDGKTKGELTLDESLFSVKVNAALVHEAVVAQTSNGRKAIAHTKTRGEVAGSGKKPWKQKGTGRARHGSRRSPIWIGGGITFGPRNDRSFGVKMNDKARRKALAMVLSDKVTHERLIAVDQLLLEEGKTKQLVEVLNNLPTSGKRTLIVTTPENKTVSRAARNLQEIETIPANTLNIVDLLRFDYVLITEPAVAMVTDIYKRN
ncbi:50S ribosomal protein L4 [Candidatus Uhrbacteria bacterium CG10_big_fil_rev_8_21_14_0_10_48_16]|uniref:Large ribosomal subunit protein uL4 n=1 Tax=Candidatus Uhrbacteria bacterium CG10_big_fil_rev_8_21_14_0_10_48_16 TaxID=1975038 RepID=A0A2M8LGV5_9BACT|nr:MAG: 50S ribosomal protein L4 [Candidatus Uhrbacteria bacterium CG10_big_fil_rev_8_21_14_0_10_48_16]